MADCIASTPQIPEYLRYVDELPSAQPEKYEIIKTIEFGGFNKIVEASLVSDPEGPRFAIKTKLKNTDITNSERMEVHALKTLEKEENVIRLVDVIRSPKDLTVVMSLAKTDLFKILNSSPNQRPISAEEKRTILFQLFNGLAAIHKHKIIHRDMKPGNVLISFEGIVQITDFGMSVPMLAGQKRNPRGGTLYYKSLEMLMEDDEYDEKVDMWAAGCSMAELWSNIVLFKPPRFAAMDQIRAISTYCGFPTATDWPRVVTFKHFRDAEFLNIHLRKNLLQSYLQKMTNGDALATDLLLQILKLNPENRMSSSDALAHEYFTQSPLRPDVKSLLQS